MRVSPHIECANEVLSRFGRHLEERTPSDHPYWSTAQLSDPPWVIRWALLTLLIFEVPLRSDIAEQIRSFRMAWTNLDLYIPDDLHFEIAALACRPDDPAAEEQLNHYRNDATLRIANAIRSFDNLLEELASNRLHLAVGPYIKAPTS